MNRIKREIFKKYITENNFVELFNELGWNVCKDKFIKKIDEINYSFKTIAVKAGYRILLCQSPIIPEKKIRKRIHSEITKLFYENLIIYIDANKSKQIWQTSFRKENYGSKISEVEYSST